MVLRDIVIRRPRVLFVGINPSLRSEAVGHHFASPGNPFWRLLYEARLIPVPLACDEDHRLKEFKMAMTNLCSRASRSAAELSREEIEAGKRVLAAKIARLHPEVVAFVGLSIYRDFFGKAAAPGAGAKDELISGARVFVLPNPSGLNASFPGFKDKLIWFQQLREFIDATSRSGSADENVETLLTSRMDADRITEDDFADLFRMNRDATVMATLAGVKSEPQTREFLQSSLEHWERHGYGIWIFRTRDEGRFVGRAGLRNVTIENTTEVELLYALMPEFWRQGFATEMSRAILEAAAALGIADIVAFTMPTNLGSRGVMETVGFTYERDFIWANLPHVLYRRTLP